MVQYARDYQPGILLAAAVISGRRNLTWDPTRRSNLASWRVFLTWNKFQPGNLAICKACQVAGLPGCWGLPGCRFEPSLTWAIWRLPSFNIASEGSTLAGLEARSGLPGWKCCRFEPPRGIQRNPNCRVQSRCPYPGWGW